MRSWWTKARLPAAFVLLLLGGLKAFWDTLVIGFVAPPQYPWAVRLEALNSGVECTASETVREYGSVVCGGTLIDSRHVLTSKHCFERDGQRYKMMVGAQNFPHAETRCAVACYDEPHGADIRLIDLGKPVAEKPPELVAAGWTPSVQDDLRVVGWGRSFIDGCIVLKTKTLMKSNSLRATDPGRCAYFQFPQPTLCAEGVGPGPRDSGGPLTLENGDQRILAGVFVRSDSEVLLATQVAQLRPWITSTLSMPTPSPGPGLCPAVTLPPATMVQYPQ